MANNFLQAAIGLGIITMLVCLSDPFMVLMSPMWVMIVLLIASVLACIFGGFILRERVADEREAIHRLNAGRMAYLAGIAVLTLGVIVEGVTQHHVDVWLSIGLAVMIATKIGSRIYTDLYR